MVVASCVDLFCGAGGLTHGFELEGLSVSAGIDFDSACRFPYEKNNKAAFLEHDVAQLSSDVVSSLYGKADVRVLAGCAPCQPFSNYANRYEAKKDMKWSLLYEFSRLVEETKPHIVTMENVPTVSKHVVFHDFLAALKNLGYFVWYGVVNCSHYGVPQSRRRMVLLASKFGEIKLVDRTHDEPKTVRETIGDLSPLHAGGASSTDKLHFCAALTEKNLERIKVSSPGGTWRDWPERLVANCHKATSGKTYPGVYGRMEWSKPAPTMTTQCFGFGNGRFGHPDQDRAISLREAALFQSFPRNYKFVDKNVTPQIKVLGRLIGNAVPVELGRVIAQSINGHINQFQTQIENQVQH